MSFVPIVRKVSDLQRQGKKALAEVCKDGEQSEPIFLSDRGDLFAVVLSVKQYEKLCEQIKDQELLDWAKASEHSLSFWNDPSNDKYNKLL